MADSQQIQAIQTRVETTPVNTDNSRTPRKRKSRSPPASSSFPIPGSSSLVEEINEESTVDKRKNYRCVDRGYEPGFRFIPKDEELIQDYLMKKLEGEPIRLEGIHEVDLYQCNPEDLAENYPHLGEFEWYFFTPRDRKYRNGLRPKRSAGNGYWKATGADKKITLDTDTPNERTIGYRKALVFYQGNPPSGKKTNWIMHEFKPHAPPRVRDNLDDMKLDDFVLCRIYEKPERPEKKVSKDQTSDQDEDQDRDIPTSNSTPEICDDAALCCNNNNNNPNGDATDFIYPQPQEDSILHWCAEEIQIPSLLNLDPLMNSQLEPSPYFHPCYEHMQFLPQLARDFPPYYPPAPVGDSQPGNIGKWVKRERKHF